jgi:periplasmic protein TonB
MSIAATFGHAPHGDSKRWVVCFALVLALHVVASVFLLRWYRSEIAPSSVPPSPTLIELAPLPAPPAPPTPAPPLPEPQVQPQVQPQEELTPVPEPSPKPVKPRPVLRHVEPPQPEPQPARTSTAPTAPAPQPTVSAPSRPSVDPAAPRLSDLIAAQLERYKRYPVLAQRRGEQGVVLLRFTLGRAGEVSNARLERSSGHADLDAEVLALVHRAEPLPQIPADIAANTLDIVVPVSFALR